MRRGILLVYPGSSPDAPGEELAHDPGRSLPMGLLCVAAALEQAGFVVHLHDARAFTKSLTHAWIHEHLSPPPLFVGISAMTVQVGHGLAIARQVRAESPETPIVWGGAHASLFALTTAADSAADFVLPREADYSIVSLARALAEGTAPTGVAGILRRDDGMVAGEERAPLPDVASLPAPAYHLVDLARYAPRLIPGGTPRRGTDVITSRGCPYRCAFCPNELLLGRSWRRRPVEHVCADLDTVLDGGRVDHVWFMDDLFLGDLPRVVRILDHLHSTHPAVTWEANARADMFRDGFIDRPFLRHLKQTGCVCLRMGAESGNDDVLKVLRKDITVEHTTAAVRLCHEEGVTPLLFFMMGIPGETQSQLFDTLAFMADLKRRFPSAIVCGPGLFRPYPGGDLYDRAKDAGLREPESLAGWAQELGPHGFLRSARLPWIEDPALMEDIAFSMFYIEEFDRLSAYSHPWLRRRLARLAFWRASHRRWRFRFEGWLRRASRGRR